MSKVDLRCAVCRSETGGNVKSYVMKVTIESTTVNLTIPMASHSSSETILCKNPKCWLKLLDGLREAVIKQIEEDRKKEDKE